MSGIPAVPSPPGHTRPSQTDGNATRAKPPSPRRATPHTAPPLPSHTPNRWERSGKKEEKQATPTAYNPVTSRARETSFLYQLLRDQVKGPADFFHHHRELHRQHGLLRIDDHIHRALQRRSPEPHRFAQPPLDPVPLDRASEHAPHRKPDARPALRLPQIKHGHVGGKVPSPLLVHALEVRVLQQPRPAVKTRSLRCCGLLELPVASVCAHQFTILHACTQSPVAGA